MTNHPNRSKKEDIPLTKEIAEKVLSTVDAGLVYGLGKAKPGQMCVEAAVCYAYGLPHSDQPPCVGSAVRRFKIRLNDSRWPTDADRTAGMRKLAIAQLGSNTIEQRAFADIVVRETIKQILPLTMRLAAAKNPKFAEEIEAAAKLCEKDGSRESARQARDLMRKASAAAYAAADAAAAAAAAAAKYAAAYAAAAAAAAKYADAAAAKYADAAAAKYAYADAAAAAAAYAAADAAADAAAAAAADAAADAAAAAAAYAAADAYAAAAAAADAAAYAAADAAAAAAAAAAADAAAAAAADAARLQVLNLCAKIGLDALIELKSLGCEFLYLCDQ